MHLSKRSFQAPLVLNGPTQDEPGVRFRVMGVEFFSSRHELIFIALAYGDNNSKEQNMDVTSFYDYNLVNS